MRLLTANDIEDEDDDEHEHDRRIEEGRALIGESADRGLDFAPFGLTRMARSADKRLMQAGGDAMLYSFRALACGGGHSANRPRHAAQAEGHLRARFRQREG